MKVEVSQKFYKDVEKITDANIKDRISDLVNFIEEIERVNEIPGLKKLKGYKDAYRIRIGDYRLGFVYAGGIVKLGRFLGRKDIYKYFP